MDFNEEMRKFAQLDNCYLTVVSGGATEYRKGRVRQTELNQTWVFKTLDPSGSYLGISFYAAAEMGLQVTETPQDGRQLSWTYWTPCFAKPEANGQETVSYMPTFYTLRSSYFENELG